MPTKKKVLKPSTPAAATAKPRKPSKHVDNLTFARAFHRIITDGGRAKDVAAELGISEHTVNVRSSKMRSAGAKLPKVRRASEPLDVDAINDALASMNGQS